MSNPTKNKKTALGRGLNSLLGGPSVARTTDADSQPLKKEELKTRISNVREGLNYKESESSRVESRVPENARIWTLSIEKIKPNPNQPRKIFSPEGIKELSDSIKEKGIFQPIIVRRLSLDRFEIIAGERRWRAAQAAGLHEVPAIIKESGDQESLEVALIENIQRRDLNPIELADAYAHLMDTYNLTQLQLAQKLGKERTTVANTLRLLGLSEKVRELISSEKLSMGHAKVILSLSDYELQNTVAKEILAKKLSVRATESLIKAKLKSADRLRETGSRLEDLDISDKLMTGLSKELQKLMGTKVSINYSKGKGKLSINFYSDEQLNDMVERIRDSWQN